MGMNTKFKVDSHFSNAYPFIHFSFFEEVVMFKFYLAKLQKSMTRDSSRVYPDLEGIGSTLRVILGTYTTSFNSK